MVNSILIVDDTPENLKVLSGILKKEGYKLRYAKSGLQAISSIEQSLPELILLDIMMPDMDGYETCLRIQEIPEAKDVPIVFLSALSETVNKLKAFEVGGVDFIEKPFHSIEVLARIRTHIALYQSKKKQVENAQRLSAAEKVSNMGSYSWNVVTDEMTYSERLLDMFELDDSEVTPKNIFETCLGFVHQEDQEKVKHQLKQVRVSQKPWSLEFRIITGLGNLKYIFASGSKGEHIQGQHTWVTGIVQDVTKFRQNEEAIKLMVNLTDDFTEEEDIEKAYEYALQRICRFMGWQIGHAFLFNNERTEFMSSGIWYTEDASIDEGFSEKYSSVGFSASILPGTLLNAQTSIWGDDFFDLHLESTQGIKKLGLKGAYALPIRVNKEVIAILEFYTHQDLVSDDLILGLLNEIGTRLGSILKQKLLINEIKENEAIQERMISSASYPIVIVSEQNEIIKVNNMFSELFGFTEDEVLGQSINMIIPHRLRAKHDDHTASYHKSPRRRNMGIGMELNALRKDGSEFPVEISLTPLSHSEGTVMASIYDVSLRKKAEQDLKESRDRLSLAVKSGNLGVWDWDIKSGTFIWDDSMYVLYDIERNEEEQDYHSFDKLLHPEVYYEDIEEVNQTAEEVLLGDGVLDISFRVSEKNGEVRHITAKGRVQFDKAGKPVRMIGVNIDMTDEIETKRELEQSNKELESFAYVASHDLQEPLRVITSYLQIIGDKYADGLEERGTYLMKRIVGASNRMKSLINDLLAYSRIDRRGSRFERTDLNELMDVVLTDSEVLINENNAKVEVGKLGSVFCDPGQMRQVFMNLLSNGIKYRKVDVNPIVKISAEPQKNNMVEITFEDNGIGIKPEFNERIFEIFQRLHTQEEYQGTGLGLAITKKIVERHKGKIKVESKFGEGAKFILALPATLANVEKNEND